MFSVVAGMYSGGARRMFEFKSLLEVDGANINIYGSNCSENPPVTKMFDKVWRLHVAVNTSWGIDSDFHWLHKIRNSQAMVLIRPIPLPAGTSPFDKPAIEVSSGEEDNGDPDNVEDDQVDEEEEEEQSDGHDKESDPNVIPHKDPCKQSVPALELPSDLHQYPCTSYAKA